MDVPVLFVCIYVQCLFNILKLMLMKEHLCFDMSVKFDTFLKNNQENIEIFKLSWDFFEWRKLAMLRATTEQFSVQVHTF